MDCSNNFLYYKDCILTQTTLSQKIQHCDGNWTQFFDRDNPSGKGDFESIIDLNICSNPTIIDAQTLNGMDYKSTGQVFNSFEDSFYCLNEQQVDKTCLDYEARYCCSKPVAPQFNLTAISLTAIRVDWDSIDGNAKQYSIEAEGENLFSTIVLGPLETTYTIENLIPYAYYNVKVYSVGYNFEGDEEKSSSKSKQVLVYAEAFCEEEKFELIEDKILITFPKTRAGYSNTTVETCPSKNGVSYGFRSCKINAVWNDPIWLTSCQTTLKDLAEVSITNNDEREEVASDLTVLTSNSSSLSSDSIEQSASVLESIVDTEELEQNTTLLVIGTLGNLLSAPRREFENSRVQQRLLTTLNKVASKVVLEEDEEFQSITHTLAFSVSQINKTSNISGLGYFDKKNPSFEELGFSEGQFETFGFRSQPKNSTSVYLPSSVTTLSRDDRVSFYALANNALFQTSTSRATNFCVNNYDPKIQSNIILSASIQGPAQNLPENITLQFEYVQSSCPKEKNLSACGKYYCGFWDEGKSIWSQYGCVLSNMTESIIECQCNHLTNFATLFIYFKKPVDMYVLNILSYVCCSISLFGSVLTITCLLFVRHSRKTILPSQTIFVMINLASALTLLNGFLLISNLNKVIENKIACTAIAVLLHFSLFATLLWTTVEAGYVSLGIVAPIYYRTSLSKTKLYFASSLLGWVVPAVFVALSGGLNLSWYKSQENSTEICWICSEKVLYVVIIPASVILAFNTVVYIVSIVTYCRRKPVGASTNSELTMAKSVLFSVMLFVIFGISWIFGFLLFSNTTFNVVFAYIFTITTGLQGFFIFILFVARNKKLRHDIKMRISLYQTDFTGMKSFKRFDSYLQ